MTIQTGKYKAAQGLAPVTGPVSKAQKMPQEAAEEVAELPGRVITK